MEKKSATSLPSIQTLFSDSWKTFKGSVLNLLLLNLTSIGIFIGVSIIGIILSIPFGLLTFFSGITGGKITPAAASSVGALGILAVLLLIIFIVISYAVTASSTIFVRNYTGKPAFGKTFKMSFRYVWPLFLVSVLSGFIAAGGYFLFIIPGIFLGVLFSFAPYEIVLNNQGVLSAMRRSARIVLSHFWGILGRLLLWIIIVMVISFLPGMFAGKNETAGAGISGLSFFVNIAVGWFGICYSLTLYKQASRGMEKDQGMKLLWPVVTGIVGWIVGIITVIALISVIALFVTGAIQKNAGKSGNPVYPLQETPSYIPLQQGTPSAQ